MKPNKEIRILDTGLVCVETTDIKGNHKVETYTMKEYVKLCARRIKQQKVIERFVLNTLVIACLVLVVFVLLFINAQPQ